MRCFTAKQRITVVFVTHGLDTYSEALFDNQYLLRNAGENDVEGPERLPGCTYQFPQKTVAELCLRGPGLDIVPDGGVDLQRLGAEAIEDGVKWAWWNTDVRDEEKVGLYQYNLITKRYAAKFRAELQKLIVAVAVAAGDFVTIRGLQSESGLNGRKGVVLYDRELVGWGTGTVGRFAVLLYEEGKTHGIKSVREGNLIPFDLTRTPVEDVLPAELFREHPCSERRCGELVGRFVVRKKHEAQEMEDARVIYDVGFVSGERLPDPMERGLTVRWEMKVWWFASQKHSWEDLEVLEYAETGSSAWRERHKRVAHRRRNAEDYFLLLGGRQATGATSEDSSLLRQIYAGTMLREIREAIAETENRQERAQHESEFSKLQQHILQVARMSADMNVVEKRQKDTLYERFRGFHFRQANYWSNDKIYRFVKRQNRVLLEFTDFSEIKVESYPFNEDSVEFLDFYVAHWPPEITGGMSWMAEKWPGAREAALMGAVEEVGGVQEEVRGESTSSGGGGNGNRTTEKMQPAAYPIELVVTVGPATEVYRRSFPWQKDQHAHVEPLRTPPQWIPFSEHEKGETKPGGVRKPKYADMNSDVVLDVYWDKMWKSWNSMAVSRRRLRSGTPFVLRKDKTEFDHRSGIPEG
eukprot:g17659.t1